MSMFDKKKTERSAEEEKIINKICKRQGVNRSYVIDLHNRLKKENKDADVSNTFLLALTEIKIEVISGINFQHWYDENKSLPERLCKENDFESEEDKKMFKTLYFLNLMELDTNKFVFDYSWAQMHYLKQPQTK